MENFQAEEYLIKVTSENKRGFSEESGISILEIEQQDIVLKYLEKGGKLIAFYLYDHTTFYMGLGYIWSTNDIKKFKNGGLFMHSDFYKKICQLKK